MKSASLARGSQGAGTKAVRERGTGGARTEQELIRAEYLELGAHLHATAAERDAAERHLVALRVRCTHADLGRGSLPGQFGQVAAPNQCPDCGYIARREVETPAVG